MPKDLPKKHNPVATAVDLKTAKKLHKKRKAKALAIGVITLAVLVICAVWLTFSNVLLIKHIQVVGNKPYAEEETLEIAESIGITPGMHLFGFHKKIAEQNAQYSLSVFDTVKISRQFPDTVVLYVKESAPKLYVNTGMENYVLSRGLRVLGRTDNLTAIETFSLPRVYLGDIDKCVAGEFLQTSDGTDDILKELLKILEAENVYPEVSAIDIKNKFDISFIYKMRYTVKIGSPENMGIKVRFMKQIEEQLEATDSGYIDVSDENYREGTFKSY